MSFDIFIKSSAFRLLRSDNFEFFYKFFKYAFIEDKLTHNDILIKLDDFMFDYSFGQKAPKEYLEDFVRFGYLKRFYENDILYYELSKDIYKVFELIDSFEKKEFVGSETKFNILIDLVEKLDFELSVDKEKRINILNQKIKTLQKEIKKINSSPIVRDKRKIKEIFYSIENITKKLILDFSEIEDSFKNLHRQLKSKIVDSSKKEVLEFTFDSEKEIRNSAEGRSFLAFWELIASRENDKLDEIIEDLDTKYFTKEELLFLDTFKSDITKGAFKIHSLISKLIEEIRIFIDEKLYLDYKRVKTLIESIEKKALEAQPKDLYIELPTKFDINLVFEKELFEVEKKQTFDIKLQEIEVEDIDFFVDDIDEEEILNNIKEYLETNYKATIKEIIDYYKVDEIAKVCVYIFAVNKINHIIIEEVIQEVVVENKILRFPQIICYKE
jgi:hypothetical protein